MKAPRFTPETAGKLNELTIITAQIRRLTEQADEIKWAILDTRELGTQTAVATICGVRRQAVGQWITARNAKKETAQ